MSNISDMPGIEIALDGESLITREDLQRQLDTGNATMWQSDKSAIFMRRVPYDTGLVVLECGPAGGDKDEILAVAPLIEQWAREIGCHQIHIHAGRYGWKREFEAQGYELLTVTMRKVL